LRSEERKAWSWFLLRWVIILALSIAAGSCLIRMPGSSYSGPFKPLSAAEVEIRESLKRHVWALAREIGEKNLWRLSAIRGISYCEPLQITILFFFPQYLNQLTCLHPSISTL
jgi:hypothetical protein